MNTILIPTDFSETANNALKVAVQLSKKHNSRLVVLHMLEIPEHNLPEALVANDVTNSRSNNNSDLPAAIFWMKLAQKRFAELRELPFLKGVDFEEAIQDHSDFNDIIDSAYKYDADLIVMGSHGTSGIKEVFVGSNTENVVRTSDVPVLVIKEEDNDFKVDNFVFASNLDLENLKSFIYAYHLATQLDAHLHLVYVNTPNSSFLTTAQIDKKMEFFIDATELDLENVTTSIYNDRSVEEGILNFSNKINGDLIGIPTHGRKGLAYFIQHSIDESIVNHSHTPVITFKIDN